jgi:hypothetical protein
LRVGQVVPQLAEQEAVGEHLAGTATEFLPALPPESP